MLSKANEEDVAACEGHGPKRRSPLGVAEKRAALAALKSIRVRVGDLTARSASVGGRAQYFAARGLASCHLIDEIDELQRTAGEELARLRETLTRLPPEVGANGHCVDAVKALESVTQNLVKARAILEGSRGRDAFTHMFAN